MPNEHLNLPDDLNLAIAEREMHLRSSTAVMNAIPRSALDFLDAPLVQTQMRIAMLTGYLAGKGIDADQPQVGPSAEQMREAAMAAEAVRAADAPAAADREAEEREGARGKRAAARATNGAVKRAGKVAAK